MAVLPRDYYLREHNAEVYVQEQIHKKLRFLNELDMQDNVTGEFTQYITTAEADEVTGDPITLAEGVEFNEIKFGKPSEKRGATIPKGFMFTVTNRMRRQGRENLNCRNFLTKAVSRMVQFYDKQFLAQFQAGAGLSLGPSDGISDWDDSTAIDPVKDEVLIADAMSQGGDSGFEAATMYLSRADYLARRVYLTSFNSEFDFTINYVPMGSALTTGTAIVRAGEPVANIEKYTDPDYSSVRKAELAAEKTDSLNQLEFPESFINVWVNNTQDKPGETKIFVWAEANVNVTEPKGIMTVNLSGS